MRVTLLHTNDIHGRVEGLARVATLVERIRAETSHRVIYVDAGDVEERTVRLSNLTNGVAMHRLLSVAGCEVAAVGNAVWLLHGAQALGAQANAAGSRPARPSSTKGLYSCCRRQAGVAGPSPRARSSSTSPRSGRSWPRFRPAGRRASSRPARRGRRGRRGRKATSCSGASRNRSRDLATQRY